jgi:hypothetical protein
MKYNKFLPDVESANRRRQRSSLASVGAYRILSLVDVWPSIPAVAILEL